MKNQLKKFAITGLAAVIALSVAVPAFAESDSQKGKGGPFNVSAGIFLPPGQLKKIEVTAKNAAKKVEKEDERQERERERLVKTQDSLFNESIRAAQETFNRAMKQAETTQKAENKTAREAFLVALKASADPAARATALAVYRSALMTALQHMLAAKQTALAAFIAAVQSAQSANQAPTATAQSVTVAEDGSLAITLAGTDPQNAALTFAIVAGPAHGTLTGTGAARVYTPAANYNGADSFTFKVNDGTFDSAVATVSITVTGISEVPVAINQSLTTAANTALAVTLSGSDVDGCSGQTFTYAVTNQPANGLVAPTTGSATCASGALTAGVTYTPSTGFTGTNSFNFKLNDGTADSASGTVTITVNP